MALLERGSVLQRGVLLASAVLFGTGLYWIGRSFVVDGKLQFGNPVSAGPLLDEALDAQPLQVRAEVTRVQGNPVVRQGDKCEFLVERRVRDRSGGVYCNAQVVCGGRLIFGGPDRGYFPCKLSNGEHPQVIGSEPITTGADQADGAIYLNSTEGILRIWDDAQGPLGEFAVEADVLSVH